VASVIAISPYPGRGLTWVKEKPCSAQQSAEHKERHFNTNKNLRKRFYE